MVPMDRATSLRMTAILIALSCLVVLMIPSAAVATDTAALASRMKNLEARIAAAGHSYEKAQWALEDNDTEIASADAAIAKTRRNLAAAKVRLGMRADGIYRSGPFDMLTVLFAAPSLDSFLSRMAYMDTIAQRDAATIVEVKALSKELRTERARLSGARRRLSGSLAGRAKRRGQLQAQLASVQADYAKVKAEIAASAAAARASGANQQITYRGTPGANGMVFPVAGANYYSDTFGAPRSGGRTHKGTDIMASRGTPVVACVSGSVSSKEGGLGGKTIWLDGAGWSLYYAHLNGWAVHSGHVSAGQVIAWVGNTGNAAGGACHLHFEMHPHGGAAVDPYPYLRGMR